MPLQIFEHTLSPAPFRFFDRISQALIASMIQYVISIHRSFGIGYTYSVLELRPIWIILSYVSSETATSEARSSFIRSAMYHSGSPRGSQLE